MLDPLSEIPFNKPSIVGNEIYYMAQAVIKNGHISGNGPFTKKCEQWLEDKLGCRRALLTHSCTAALEMAAMLCEIKHGDEVILPSFTFVSTANAIVLRGGVPVFVDIRRDTLNINENFIEKAINSRTKAIVPVHYGGAPCDMATIMSIAHKHDLWVIEDAAQGLLSSYQDQKIGTVGHIGCLSFHETKNVISGEGGALLINDERFIERAEIIREKGTNRTQYFRGQVDKYTWLDIGSSYLPSDLIAAFLFAQLQECGRLVEARRKLAEYYGQALLPLAEKGFFELPSSERVFAGNGHIYYILVGSLGERDQLIKFLKKRRIATVFHYVPLHSSPAGLKYGRVSGTMDVTNDVSDRLLRLPLYYEMTSEAVNRVVQSITNFYKTVGRKEKASA
ncbi:MAG: dTDP-4-amino-4,6-dideoxygalactose transaminase [Desulfomonilaceae bacterium]|jgi:dTDP-4-amino-4,6-dideoxygalactose transaminase